MRVQTVAQVMYLKVVRPSHTAELHTQYQLWGSAGLPVPATLGWSDEGLIAFSALSGVPAHERVAQLGDAFSAL